MCCGYKQSGKDTFYLDIIYEDVHNNWDIYYLSLDSISFISNTKYKRVAFADPLKKYVISKYNIDNINNKEEYRHLLIKEGQEAKKYYPHYWTEQSLLNCGYCDNIFITDWRFMNEYEYISDVFIPTTKPSTKLITVRVARSSNINTNYDDETEHSLDNVTTDFLIVSKDDDINKITEVFPQYRNFKKY
jgi:hypothetical protein